MKILQQQGNFDDFFNTVYGFLGRNTGFFGNQKISEEIIVNNYKINFQKYNSQTLEKQEQERIIQEEQEKKRKLKEEKESKEQHREEIEVKNAIEVEKQPEKVSTFHLASNLQEKTQQIEIENSFQMLKYKGGRTQKYIWIQTLENLEMYIFVDHTVTKKKLLVMYTFDSLCIVINGFEFLGGKWRDQINAEKTYWNMVKGCIEDYKGKYIYIKLQKLVEHSFSRLSLAQFTKNKYCIIKTITYTCPDSFRYSKRDMRPQKQSLSNREELSKQQKLIEFMNFDVQIDL